MQLRLHSIFGIDPRALATLRVSVGLLMLASLYERKDDMRSMFSDSGLCSRELTLALSPVPEWWSLYFMSGNVYFTMFLFLVTATLAMLLMLGFRTRIITLLSWIMIVSLGNRNPMFQDAEQTLLRLLLLYGMFLPWGDYFSFDRTLRTDFKPNSRKSVFSLATAAILLQVAIIYLFNAYLRDGPEWRADGTALMYAMNVDFLTTRFGVFLCNFPELLRVMTFACILWEGVASLLLFAPNAWVRLIAVAGFVCMWVMIGATNKVGLLAEVSVVSFIPFLPPMVWNFVSAHLNQRRFYRDARNAMRQTALTAHQLLPGAESGRTGDRLRLARNLLFNGGAVCSLVLAFLWNLHVLPQCLVTLPAPIARLGLLLRLDQNWYYWAHFVPQLNGYYVMPGMLANGKEVDIFRDGKPVSWLRPAEISADYRNRLWSIYMLALFNESYKDYRRSFAEYIRKEWNQTHSPDEQLVAFEIYYMYEGPLPEIRSQDRTNPYKAHVYSYPVKVSSSEK